MKVAIAAIALVLIVSVAAAYGAMRTRPQSGQDTVATTTFPLATTTSDGTPVAPSASNGTYGTQAVISIGQTLAFPDGFSVTPASVIEDSRCPTGVMCIQAGTVRVDLTLSGAGSTQHQTIGLGKTVTVNGRTITFSAVTPAKHLEVEIPAGDYRFTLTVAKAAPVVVAKCYVGGCSGQICSDQPDAVSTCEYRAEYACYKQATCERQSNGQCGWTQTTALASCLAASR